MKTQARSDNGMQLMALNPVEVYNPAADEWQLRAGSHAATEERLRAGQSHLSDLPPPREVNALWSAGTIAAFPEKARG